MIIRKYKIIYLSFLVLSLNISCTDKNKTLRDLASIVTDVKEPEGCQKLGVVTGVTMINSSVNEAYKATLKDLKSLAYDKGANFVFIKRMSQDSKFMSGEAYRCNKEKSN
jgi:hypothetical protein